MIPTCERCNKESVSAAEGCCSSHRKFLCHDCYRRTHFVEVCSAACTACAAEGLPTIVRRATARPTLYIRSAHDMPHARNGAGSLSKCGLIIGDAKPITEKQALVYLENARCLGCFPNWNPRAGHGRAAA
jgi:hypothetical protein